LGCGRRSLRWERGDPQSHPNQAGCRRDRLPSAFVNGIEVTRQIRARLRRTEVLLLVNDDCEPPIEATLKAGARGFLTVSEVQYNLVDAVDSLARRMPFFTTSVAEALLESFLAKGTPASGRGP
jgi:DNA-binding NarL/FixJ family response regulator